MTFKTATDLFNESRARIRQVTPEETMRLREADPDLVLLDCREPNEWNLGHVPGAVFIPRGILESNVEAAVPRTARVVIYCASGNRSALATETLLQMGYTDVASMSGGIRGWVAAGGDLEG
ncbi:MAG TPA: rhodanese-like domain-containing protein [Gemmatimonadaceae bacterium]|nr:rhodanese-like domain-containing protein [Gemmatimonadaceae bacterium]